LLTRKEKRQLIEENTPFEQDFEDIAQPELRTIDIERTTSLNTKKEIFRLKECLTKEQ